MDIGWVERAAVLTWLPIHAMQRSVQTLDAIQHVGSALAQACDFFSLANVKASAEQLEGPWDVVVLSHGMATVQGFTPTPDGLDEKLTLQRPTPATRSAGKPRGLCSGALFITRLHVI